MRTPLAWLNTTTSISRLSLGASGIAFAVVLMFMQIGFLNGLFDSAVQVLRLIDAELILLSPARYTVPSEQRIRLQIIQRVQAHPLVDRSIPLYIDRALSDVRVMGHVSRSIRTIGVPSDTEVFLSKEMNEKSKQLRNRNQALVDRRSKPKYGFEKQDLNVLREQEAELTGKKVEFEDWVDVGTDFVYDGTLIVSERGVEHFFPMRNPNGKPLEAVDLGLVRLKDKSAKNIEIAKTALSKMLGEAVQVMTRKELIDREIGFWARNTPIGAIFSIGTVMGLFVGVIICYQILFTDISDHLAEFATLKAMGYGSMYFLRFILAQSFYRCVFGFFPGWLISLGLYYGLAEWTGLVMRLTFPRVVLVFGLTYIMCTVSGLLAVRKLWAADPATLFK